MGALLVLLVAGGAAAAFALQSPGDPRPTPRARSVAQLPPCRDVRPSAAEGGTRCRDRTALANAARRQDTTAPRRPARPAHRRRQHAARTRTVRLSLVATGPVYVCVRAGQRVLVPGRMLQAGEQAGPFRATRFTMTLGNRAITMRVAGRPPISPTASPSGYVVDRRGARLVTSGTLPTCV